MTKAEAQLVCGTCESPIRMTEGHWVHVPPYDPFDPPIHAPRPRSAHQHEEWQIEREESERPYCKACGGECV
jgi:hypothetical protein